MTLVSQPLVRLGKTGETCHARLYLISRRIRTIGMQTGRVPLADSGDERACLRDLSPGGGHLRAWLHQGPGRPLGQGVLTLEWPTLKGPGESSSRVRTTHRMRAAGASSRPALVELRGHRCERPRRRPAAKVPTTDVRGRDLHCAACQLQSAVSRACSTCSAAGSVVGRAVTAMVAARPSAVTALRVV